MFSEGSVSWTEAWNMGFSDRRLIIETINKYNKMRSGDKGAGDFSGNTVEGDYGFDPVNLE